jgi:hypothetical protein
MTESIVEQAALTRPKGAGWSVQPNAKRVDYEQAIAWPNRAAGFVTRSV